MASILFFLMILALYTRLYKVKQERNQYKNTLLMKQAEQHKQK